MNEKRIREVIEIEKQAEELIAKAGRDAERLPVEAEIAAREMIEKARASARDEAERILERAGAEDEAAGVLSKARERMAERETLAARNLDKAIAHVLQRVLGKA